mmetsp:Transcript_6947/g.10000  ORF Transcript_6947/g.10000 Transcript_6947/m.10000 type:complete len:191 (-) Transcript_6947:1228-1800(-)
MDNIAKGIPHMSLDIDEEAVVENATTIREKQGHSCCGGCCDVRRAVIIICIINIVGNTIIMLLSATTKSMAHGIANGIATFDDDMFNSQAADQSVQTLDSELNSFMIIEFARIVAAGLAMLGAFTFNKYLVAINVISLLVPSVGSIIVGLLINGLFLYPHVFLILYIHNGIMTKENYPYERQSCCCVPPV